MAFAERVRTVNRLLKRVGVAVRALGLGISVTAMDRDFIGAVNSALRQVGGVQLSSLDEQGPLLRAAIALESAAP